MDDLLDTNYAKSAGMVVRMRQTLLESGGYLSGPLALLYSTAVRPRSRPAESL
jgi:hypothetical protein